MLTLNHNDENQESLHYARGCYRTLKNYLRDVHTTLEYNAHDHLANIDNPLLLNIQAYTADQRLNPSKSALIPDHFESASQRASSTLASGVKTCAKSSTARPC